MNEITAFPGVQTAGLPGKPAVCASVATDEASELYVVVDMRRTVYGLLLSPGWYPVLPWEEPHTYNSLAEAAEYLAGELDELPDGIAVFKLQPVDRSAVVEALARAMGEQYGWQM